jgi:hypothetical protein
LDQPVANPLPNTNTEWTHADIHALKRIRNHNPIVRVSEIISWKGDQHVANTLPNTNTVWTHADIHPLNCIRTHNSIVRVSENMSFHGGSAIANPVPNTNTEWTHADIHALNGIRNHNPSVRVSENISWTGDQPSQIRYLTQIENERTQTSMPWMGFEPTIPLFEWAKLYLWTGNQPVANPQNNTKSDWTHADIHSLNGIRTHNSIVRVSVNISLDGGSARRKYAT